MILSCIALLMATLLYPALSDRPNIILILADDLDNQYGEWIDNFPKINSLLADQGMTFTNSFVSVGLCCPSRASSLTGRYSHNTKILTNEFPDGCFQTMYDLGLENFTVATWLQKAGYKTALFGKYLNGYPGQMDPAYIPIGWSEWYAQVYDHYEQYNYILNKNGSLAFYGSATEDYEQDVLKRLAVDFIKRASLTEEPFFIWMASLSPHRRAAFAHRYARAFPRARAPRPPSFNDPNIASKSLWTHKLPLLNAAQIARLDNLYRRRLRSMLAVEDTVEAIVMALKQAGQLANTYIFFSSDNGYHLGQHRMFAGKGTEFEEDLRVPLIVSGPGIPKGVWSDAMVLNIDLAPTFAELAGVLWPESVDGRSLLPLLTEFQAPADGWRQAFLLEHGVDNAMALPGPFKGIHTIDKVYIDYRYQQPKFYDLENDPYQQDGRIRKADAADELNQLASWLEALRICAGPTCRAIENTGP